MADLVSQTGNPPIVGSATSDLDDDFDNACSICLEAFNSQDPPTGTNCRHEYHLHCILEWSQRSKECPICWQLLVLKDPTSQELLDAVENERNLRTKQNSYTIVDNYRTNHGNSYLEDSDFEEDIIQQFASLARRSRYVNRRGRQRSSGIGTSQILLSDAPSDFSQLPVLHVPTTSTEEHQNSSYEFSEADSPTSSMLTTIHAQAPSHVVSDDVSMEPNSIGDRERCIGFSQLPHGSPQRTSSSELLAFSKSIKSKFSAASARYKESISKGTQGFREKLLARNISVKELGRGVQREMNAGIAGVARMIERLDLTPKRADGSVPPSNYPGGSSNVSYEGKYLQESVTNQYADEYADKNAGEIVHHSKSASATSANIRSTMRDQSELPVLQGGN